MQPSVNKTQILPHRAPPFGRLPYCDRKKSAGSQSRDFRALSTRDCLPQADKPLALNANCKSQALDRTPGCGLQKQSSRPARSMPAGSVRASAFGATIQRRRQAGSRSVAAARGEGRKALSANRLSSLTQLILGNTGARAGDKPSRSHRISSRINMADLPAQRVPVSFRARPTAAGGAYSLEHAGRYFSDGRPAPRIQFDHLAHSQKSFGLCVSDNSQFGRRNVGNARPEVVR